MSEVNIPSFEEFSDHVKKIYFAGNIRDAYAEVAYHIENHTQDDDKTPVTYDYIMDKWESCIKLWNNTYGNKKPEFLKADQLALKYDLHTFVTRFLYNNEYSLDKGDSKRNEYLFVPWLTLQEQSEFYKKINEKINERRKQIIGE